MSSSELRVADMMMTHRSYQRTWINISVPGKTLLYLSLELFNGPDFYVLAPRVLSWISHRGSQLLALCDGRDDDTDVVAAY